MDNFKEEHSPKMETVFMRGNKKIKKGVKPI